MPDSCSFRMSMICSSVKTVALHSLALSIGQSLLQNGLFQRGKITACEGFFGRLKTELFYAHDWKAIAIDQFVREVDAFIRWYNEKRIKTSLDHSARSSIEEALVLTHKTVQLFIRTPARSVLGGNQQLRCFHRLPFLSQPGKCTGEL